MTIHLMAFLTSDAGQDITEYSLLLAFVVLISAAIFLVAQDSVVGIWGDANSQLNRGMEYASR
jgi:Flp pilus assembly pilin Flp